MNLHPGLVDVLEATGSDELGLAKAMARGVLTSPQRYGAMWLFDVRVTGTGASYRAAAKGADGKVLREEEFVWRDKAIYLNDRFLERCSGLPVIWEHPEGKPQLDSEEFADRVVGTVFVPYVRGDEVWAVVRIYDASAAEMMTERRFSTSPAVIFSPTKSGNRTVRLEDGKAMLIEGQPVLLDHLALCEVGVWDKGGPAQGVRNDDLMMENGRMADSEEKAGAGKDTGIAAVMDAIKSMHGRLDAMEEQERRRDSEREERNRFDAARKDRFGARKDGEKYDGYRARHDADEGAMAAELEKGGCAADRAREDAARARRDAEEEHRRSDESFEKWAQEEQRETSHGGEKKEDAIRKDEGGDSKSGEAEEKEADKKGKAAEEKMLAEGDSRKDSRRGPTIEDLQRQIAELTAKLSPVLDVQTVSERDAIAAAQSRADSVFSMFGDRAPLPAAGERPIAYRKRLLRNLQRHSDRFKNSRFDALDAATLAPVEDQVYADAVAASSRPDAARRMTLVPHHATDIAGRRITTFTGDPMAWMQFFTPQPQIGRIVRRDASAAR